VTTVNPAGADTPFWGTRTVDKTKLMQASEVVDIIWAVINLPDNVQVHCIDFESFNRFK
jgi:NADP-dependent 3-hydroxy acid dehydrogenase YdfG